jgi:hypothetical protein
LLPVTTSFVFCLLKYSSHITIEPINSFLLDVVDLLPPILIILVLCCVIFSSVFEETYGDHTGDFKREQDPSLVMPLESEKLTKQGRMKTSTKRPKVIKVKIAQIR